MRSGRSGNGHAPVAVNIGWLSGLRSSCWLTKESPIWRLRSKRLSAPVAIKIPRYLSDPRLRERFVREVYNLGKLEHRFIVRLYDHGICPDGTPYFAMEFIDGKPLDEYCRDKSLPLKERVRLLRAV